MKDMKINVSESNCKAESLRFLREMASSIPKESVVSVTIVKEDFIIATEIKDIFSEHNVLWYLNKGIEIDSLFVTELDLKMSVPSSLIVTANNDNHFAIMNSIASGMIGEKDCTAKVYNIAKSLLRLSS